MLWMIAAVGSAVFAGITAILSKCGVKNTHSDVATAIRTSVVFVFAWFMVWLTGTYRTLPTVSAKSWTFLILSGLATGASWICYFKALSLGEASKVAAVDKSGVILSILFALLLFPEERNAWQIKLICLILIGIGTFLMTDIQKGSGKKSALWLLFALFSAGFAAATSILAKIGIEAVDSNAATAIRTSVVLLMSWLIVVTKRESRFVKQVTKKDLLFLVLSGIATGASWLCYYYAIQNGQVSVVIPIDKMSILVTVLFSSTVLKEHISNRAKIGLLLLTAGTVLMAICS